MAGHFDMMRIAAVIALVAFAATSYELDAEPTSVSRLSLSLEPLRLSVSESQEYKAWSAYARGLYMGIESGKREDYLKGVERALLLMPRSLSLRMRWAESAEMLKLSRKVACVRFGKIYESAPDDADTVLFYSKLLRESGQVDKSLEILRRGIELTDVREGLLIRDFVMVNVVNGKMREPERKQELVSLLSRALKLPDLRHRDAVIVAQGYYWLHLSDELLERIAQLEKSMQSASGKDRKAVSSVKQSEVALSALRKEVADLRRKSISCLSEVDVIQTDPGTAFLICVAFDSLKLYDRLQAVLHALKGTSAQDAMWLQYSFKASEATGDYGDLYDYLDVLKFTVRSSEELLVRSVRAYLARPGHFPAAIRLARLMVAKRPKYDPHRQLLTYLLYATGQNEEGLKVLGVIPEGKRTQAAHLLWGRMLMGMGKNQAAYDYWKKLGDQAFQHTKTPGNEENLLGEYYQNMGLLCLNLRHSDEALDYFRRGYEQEPASGVWCNLYGYTLADLGRDLPQAEKLIRQALAQDPKNVAYLDSLSWVHYRQGRYEEALKVMIQVIELGGLAMDSSHEMHGHLRAIFKKLGMPKTALLYEFDLE